MNRQPSWARGCALAWARTGALALLLSTGAAAAEEMNYTYIQGGYVDTEIDDGVDVDGDGFFIGGSIALNETLFLVADYATQEFDFGIDIDQWAAGVGGHLPLTERLDVVGQIVYIRADADTGFGSVDDDGFGLGVGLRSRVTDLVELEGGINYVDLDDGGDDTSLAFGGRYYVTPEFAVGGSLEFGDDVTTWSLGLRYEFPVR